MKPNWIYLDVEPLRSEEEVGDDVARFGCSLAIAYSTRADQLRFFTEDALPELATLLRGADAVVGYRLLTFDMVILDSYRESNLDGVRCLDIRREFVRDNGWMPVGVENLAQSTCGGPPATEDWDAFQWWREGRRVDMAAECSCWVLAMQRLHQHALDEGWVRFRDAAGQIRQVDAAWGLSRAVRWPLSVRSGARCVTR